MKRNIFGRKNQDELNRRDLFSTESTELNRIDLEYEEVYADEASMYEQLITSDEDLYGSDDTNYRDEMSDESIYETEISDESIYEIEAIDKTVYETEASEAMAHETAVSDETFYETDAIDESVYEDEYFTQEQYETDGGTYDSYEADDAITAQNLEIYEADDAFEVQDLNIYNEDEVQSKPRSYHAVREDRSERRFGVLDMVLLGAGGLLLVFAVLTAVSYFQKQSYQRELQAFLTVGRAIDHIDTIGQEGILGVETLLRNTQEPDTPPLTTQEPDDEYDEIDYSRQVTVSLSLVSIQKDLKIKFIDRSTGKLISNVPFVVEIEDPDGAKKSWSDVDLDGIIYEKNIKAGIYKVQLQQLSGDKYRNYVLPGGRESVDVRRDLVYEKVDVSNEIKGESEINVAKEDTEQKETVVESTLTDTVPWVESTRVAQNYIELPKDQILKPEDVLTQALDGLVVRRVEKINRVLMDQQDVSPGDGENPGVVFPDISLTVANTTLSVVTAKTTTTEITATQLPANSSLSYTITPTDSTIAAAELLQNHKTLQIYAKAPGTVSFTITAKLTTYEGNLVPDTVDNPAPTATAQIEVIVTDPMTLSLNYPKINVYVGEPFTITSTVNHVRPYAPQSDITTSLLTSDASVLTASFDANASQTTAVLIPDDQNRAYNAITLTPLKVGVATLTVNLGEGNDLIKATCVVNAVVNPKNDRETPLVDKASNKQLYVLENNVYREAKYADYYNDALKFYIQTDEIYTGWQTLNGSVYYFDASGKKVTGSQVIQGAQYQFASDGALVVGSGTTGIDVSKWNGKIDWNAVKNSGVSYVIIRCGYRGSSQGALVEDPRFKENMKGAIAAGLKVGVYFFTQAIDVNEAVVEASMVLDLIKPYRISYPVFLDVEASGGRADSLSNEQRTEICKAFCETIKAGGYTPGIYANKTWFSTKMDANALSSYKIWLAQYASAPTYTGRYDMWQYKSTGKVSGITGEVDLNISYLGY